MTFENDKRIFLTFQELLKTRIVTEKQDSTYEFTPQDFIDFEVLLNKSTPVNEFETNLRLSLRLLYHKNKESFVNYLTKTENKSIQFLLWTDGKTIAEVLNIQQRIFIIWDNTTQKYTVKRFVNPAKHTTKKQYFNRGYFVAPSLKKTKEVLNDDDE